MVQHGMQWLYHAYNSEEDFVIMCTVKTT